MKYCESLGEAMGKVVLEIVWNVAHMDLVGV